MASRRTTRQMSDAHEAFLAGLIDGRRTPGSGNQFANQLDVRNDGRRQEWPFALDGKSTFARSISVSLAAWNKVEDQAHLESPGLALRFYHDERLRLSTDLIVISAFEFRNMLEELRG